MAESGPRLAVDHRVALGGEVAWPAGRSGRARASPPARRSAIRSRRPPAARRDRGTSRSRSGSSGRRRPARRTRPSGTARRPARRRSPRSTTRCRRRRRTRAAHRARSGGRRPSAPMRSSIVRAGRRVRRRRCPRAGRGRGGPGRPQDERRAGHERVDDEDLRAERAAQRRRPDAHLGDRQAEDLGELLADVEDALGRGRHGQDAVGLEPGRRGVRLEVALVDPVRAERRLDRDRRRRPAPRRRRRGCSACG